ncbi:unnamed protein product (macronuclear) [Paramecium tetraurelia]|uniref:Transmembrane protein n=1 Tax=Paramecium tetraurelia TaxID=5888 RepID=A0BYA8_PARTE|nr:uncharacterized protein GSPATT00033378001 [Paramecium tetraurelia]CAK63525.1 unnamed protein product [Paramecium tetraurelia]|eukprot:XP_001430923.1 hypothetical protein (macronuclear) [Paramecium tetraurelia strain d4-2]
MNKTQIIINKNIALAFKKGDQKFLKFNQSILISDQISTKTRERSKSGLILLCKQLKLKSMTIARFQTDAGKPHRFQICALAHSATIINDFERFTKFQIQTIIIEYFCRTKNYYYLIKTVHQFILFNQFQINFTIIINKHFSTLVAIYLKNPTFNTIKQLFLVKIVNSIDLYLIQVFQKFPFIQRRVEHSRYIPSILYVRSLSQLVFTNIVFSKDIQYTTFQLRVIIFLALLTQSYFIRKSQNNKLSSSQRGFQLLKQNKG